MVSQIGQSNFEDLSNFLQFDELVSNHGQPNKPSNFKDFYNWLSPIETVEDLPNDLLFGSMETISPQTANLPLMSEVSNFPVLSPEATLDPEKISLKPKSELEVNNLFDPVVFLANEFPEIFHEISLVEATISEINENIYQGFWSFSIKVIEISLDIFKFNEIIEISNNLLPTLSPPKNVSGMLYADRYWKTEKVPDYFGKSTKSLKNGKRNPVNPKDLHEVAGVRVPRPRFSPSFWDLIFVLLQPPLEFGKTENLLLPHDLYPYQVEGVKFNFKRTCITRGRYGHGQNRNDDCGFKIVDEIEYG